MLDRALTPPIDAGPNKARIAADLQREAEEMVRVRQIQRLEELRLSTQNPKVDIIYFSRTLNDTWEAICTFVMATETSAQTVF